MDCRESQLKSHPGSLTEDRGSVQSLVQYIHPYEENSLLVVRKKGNKFLLLNNLGNVRRRLIIQSKPFSEISLGIPVLSCPLPPFFRYKASKKRLLSVSLLIIFRSPPPLSPLRESEGCPSTSDISSFFYHIRPDFFLVIRLAAGGEDIQKDFL